MKLTIAFLIAVCGSMAIAADAPSPEVQIAGAVLAAPAELRDGAAVLGFDSQGKRVKIREGKNESLHDLSIDEREQADYKSAEPLIFERLRDEFRKWESTVLPYPGTYEILP